MLPHGAAICRRAVWLSDLRSIPGNKIERLKADRLGQRLISADTAVRIGKCQGTCPAFWMGLQTEYDLQVAKDALAHRIDHEVIVLPAKKAP